MTPKKNPVIEFRALVERSFAPPLARVLVSEPPSFACAKSGRAKLQKPSASRFLPERQPARR